MLIKRYINKTSKAAPLAVFRVLFGSVMFFSILRFWANGWIESLYLDPIFHFKYFGFDWVQVPGKWTYFLFLIAGISSIGIILGYRYRLSTILFFLSFTYIELMDKTTYLNHYYFVSLVSFLLILLPSHVYFSLDTYRKPNLHRSQVYRWQIDALLFLISIVYIYAGLAKINADWLCRALPLSIWLPTREDIPILGSLLTERWVAFAFSWIGMFYDTFIVFFLIIRRTRTLAYVTVCIFHFLTWLLFPIGVFPFLMIVAATLFFSENFHEKIIQNLRRLTTTRSKIDSNEHPLPQEKWRMAVIASFLVIQLCIPWRYLLYDSNIFWAEEGYRFSWRVMLMEKTGYANFKVVNIKTGKRFYVQNQDFLSPLQEKQMSTQADFIIQYAHYLGDHFTSQGHENIAIYVESYASLNGRPSQAFISSDINLLDLSYDLKTRDYVLPLEK